MAKKESSSQATARVWTLMRLYLGATLLWAFIDKLFGLGFSTCRDTETETVTYLCKSSILAGGSATKGFLSFATSGPLAHSFQSLAGNPVVDWLFLLGLLAIGTALLLGIGLRVAAVTGTLLFALMWSAALPPANNPLLDEHILYILVLWGTWLTRDQQLWSLGPWWKDQELVKDFPFLR